MNLIKIMMVAMLIMTSAKSIAREGGDDAGNGGFAYKQSITILKMAAEELEVKILDSRMQEFDDHPEWRLILQNTLAYQSIEKLPKKDRYRAGRKLAMDYQVTPPKVTVLKAYFEAFAGKTTSELDDASLEVQKRLIHEAAHIWGYNEVNAEKFAVAFMLQSEQEGQRPNGDISIKNDFCSCQNGKSDIINYCDQFCANKPHTSEAILYVNTLIGSQTALHPKLGNLFNWCTVQLSKDQTTPQCVLVASDGDDQYKIPVSINMNSNAFSANISSLAKNKSWVLKLVEHKTGSAAETKEFQLRRQGTDGKPSYPTGALKVNSVNQYTCLNYGGKADADGNVHRTTYAKIFHYFDSTDLPAPIPSNGGMNQSLKVCHDEQVHPGPDSTLYERLELVDNHMAMWDPKDVRFTAVNDTGKLMINKILEELMRSEFGTTSSLDLFRSVFFANPLQGNSALGYMMPAFIDRMSGVSFCPTEVDYEGDIPLFNLLGRFIKKTEGLYLAEKEAEVVLDGTTYKTFYGTMFVRESILTNYAFYIENGLKVKADKNSLNTKTIFYYWPVSESADPMNPAGRKLFTVKSANQLNGNIPIGIPSNSKRLGCIPAID